MFDKIERLTFGNCSSYILELTLKGYSDNKIATALSFRWSYLFPCFTHSMWLELVEEFREKQKQGISCPCSCS